ncbi:MAG TPA: AbrB/MazE/SpoVT family DNA-binding domain-containing protein [Candidatus Limnocylindrales bacterium]|nr:AbrB/MazE/SpoVT family DNA-binding domain-containing protein [Candidatus Limnocylindrales bacterium]
MVEVVSVTKKGQATIPKRFRQKYGITDKVIFEENECGIVLRPVPLPSQERGSLKEIFKGKTARELVEEARKEERAEERNLERHARKVHV